MPKNPKTGGYSDTLAATILVTDPHKDARKFRSHLHLYTREMQKTEAEEVLKARIEKLPALMAHFDIDTSAPDYWRQLAMALAIKHVPGFKYRRKTGAPRVENVELLSRLLHFYEAQRTKATSSRKVSDRMVARAMLRDPGFLKLLPELKGAKEKRLLNLLSEAKSIPAGLRVPAHPSPLYKKYARDPK